ncbi:glycosyltransferase [Pedobacter frigidisoli]|uniref:glycosyltransferase n=1 Tax=Pedobacter frigidisoli TaxID=2530455 RepID=UPI00292F651F|nr:glycosyltransferase [Pedobacter frigidisoli]
MDCKVRIFIITYRRPVLLKRALASLINQSYTNWIAEVINDDPADHEVDLIIKGYQDERIYLSIPVIKRGATGNFNYAFASRNKEKYASILEDDNWWEKDFLFKMITALSNRPDIQLAVSNENIWSETGDGEWIKTGNYAWNKKTDIEFYGYELKDKCGSAKICNSAMLWKTDKSNNWLTPDDLPVDVTEHFRERVIPHPILVVNEPCVNFSVTQETARSQKLWLWGSYQVLLISSVFKCTDSKTRINLANELWLTARNGNKPYITSLLHTGLSLKSARILWMNASILDIFRYLLTWIKSPLTCYKIIRSPQRLSKHFNFLTSACEKE